MEMIANYKLRTTEYHFEEAQEMHGVKRVLIFCILIVILPATLIVIPLYLRRTVFADVVYPVAESDIIEIRDGISSIFCQQHSLKMSSNFNAFQLAGRPEISTNHKHIRLKKSMTLPDDTFEYWGFYLLKGARVLLKFCSRYDGARMLVVKGARELDTCGLLDHNKKKFGPNWNQGHEQVKVFFEDFEVINENIRSDELVNSTDIQNATENSDHLMEMENRGAEDLTEDIDEDGSESEEDNTTTTTTTEIPKTTKVRRKKLKKGSPNSQKQRENNGNSLKTSEEDINPLKQMNSQEDLNIPRIRRTSQHKAYLERHARDHEQRKQKVYDQLYKHRPKRDHVYDRKYTHGGNAMNFTQTDESNSISSFENGLLECFKTNKLSFGDFPPMADCTNPHFLENGSHRMLSIHEIDADGYYYYIFYSDNDMVRNDIHAIFDIYKPTFEYSNLTNQQACVNATNCTFPIGFMSDEIVVVEVPTRDGIEHEDDDITYLISTCHPRPEIYAIFPVLVLILILSCSFL
ncbi:uncharacterized protein LOC135952147 isoform X2 [Calliphora vicina]|uniref:uncharacterized protein LOC135952147 isoform X2 n=1 Tax=Calliphora vicina TaxID=7373 RepID=UPI00325BEB0F